jgi:hypothetical protein
MNPDNLQDELARAQRVLDAALAERDALLAWSLQAYSLLLVNQDILIGSKEILDALLQNTPAVMIQDHHG